ncbi:hypothetical protein [Streptomyces sp. LMG1-1-1.1]|uniref:hypothetical protein n=1 Tax=Streptomyces sp. LMG1-1-1.1 TaxID=3135245 RepID=UPI003465FDE2
MIPGRLRAPARLQGSYRRREHLEALPHQGLVMGHDATQNATVLKEAIDRLGAA